MKKLRNLTKNSLLLAISVLLPVAPISAEELIDGSDIYDILNIAKEFGSATLKHDENDKPKIWGIIGGNAYYLTFRNCSAEDSCENFYFQAFIIKPVIDLELANEWNFKNRWTKLYFDDVNDAVLEMDVNLSGGVSTTNLEQAFSIWSQNMQQFFDGYLQDGYLQEE